METWIIFSLIYPALYAVTNIFDRHIVDKRVRNPYSWAVYLSIVRLFFSVLILIALSWPEAPLHAVLVTLFGGVLFSICWFLYFKAVSTTHVSEVMGMFYMYPVITALLAIALLGESISAVKLFAIFLSVAGALLLGVKRDFKLKRFYVRMVFWVVMIAAVFNASGEIVIKYATPYMSPWHIFAFIMIGFFFTSAVFSLLSKKTVKGLADIVRNPFTMLLGFLTETTAGLAMIIFAAGAALQKVSYVAAFGTLQPMFVFIFATVLSIILPSFIKEELAAKSLATKFVAILLVVSGVLIITLI